VYKRQPQTVVLPSFATGDLLIVGAYAESSGITINSWTYGGSTTAFTRLWYTGSQGKFECRYRVMQAGDSGDISLDLSATKRLAYVVLLVPAGQFDAAAAPEASVATESFTSSPNPPSLNPSGWDVEDTLWLVISQAKGTSGLTVNSYPSSYTGLGYYNGAQASIAAAYRPLAAASEDPGTLVWSGTSYANAGTIAVRPAAVADVTIDKPEAVYRRIIVQ